MKTFILVLFIIFYNIPVFSDPQRPPDYEAMRELIVRKYEKQKPHVFSMWTPGVKKKIHTMDKIVVLTLDACGGRKGNGYDKKLIDFLIRNHIPATLFLTGLWIDANPEKVRFLASVKLFDIENHGLRHKPCSVAGFKIYGRCGTRSVADAYDEIEKNARKIQLIVHRRPRFYRPGTAYFDDVAVKITESLGHIPMNFSVISGDAVKTFSHKRIYKRIMKGVKPGSVIIGHMNQLDRRLYMALKAAVPMLKKKGYRFVRLSDYDINLK